MQHNNRLGKGLSSLLGEKKLNLSSDLMSLDFSADKVQKINIDSLIPNPFQPRKYFDSVELEELAKSISEYGILQPIIIRKSISDLSKFEIIAGERRYRASKLANLKIIPAIIKEFDDKDVLGLAIIENIQRSDISAIEEADAYFALMDNFNYTQEDVAKFVGKSRSHIANLLRLLNLPIEIRNMMSERKIDVGHAKILIGSDNAIEIANMIVEGNLTVRETETLISDFNKGNANKILKEKSSSSSKTELSIANEEYFKKIEENIFKKINLKSKISFNTRKESGRIIINYSSIADLENFLNKIGEE